MTDAVKNEIVRIARDTVLEAMAARAGLTIEAMASALNSDPNGAAARYFVQGVLLCMTGAEMMIGERPTMVSEIIASAA